MSEFQTITIEQGYLNFGLALVVAIISFVSACIVYNDYKHRKDKERAEKSIEIAKSFALNIITPISLIYAFFETYKLDKIINKINFLELEDFDIEELNSIYTSEDVENYKKIMNTNDPEGKISTIIGNTLNRLEYMCMYIVTEVADEKYIYSSLHQQFLSAIASLYFEISLINTDDKDKYFTNIISVYNLWKDKYIEATKKEKEFKDKQKKIRKELSGSTPKIK